MKKSFEEKQKIAKQLKPIDDAFFEVLIRYPEVCEEMLRVILEEPNLKVISVTPQNSIKNLHGKSVRLDALCQMNDETFCNIEVQKSDNDNHVKRVRYNASCVTANIEDPGESYENVPDLYMVYISRFDMFNAGKTIYHVEKTISETGQKVDDGIHEIYVNTKINDGTTIAELMQCLEQENVDNKKFPCLTAKVKQYKETEEGVSTMCELIEQYARDHVKEFADEAKMKERMNNVKNIMNSSNKSFEEVCNMLRFSAEEQAELKEYMENYDD